MERRGGPESPSNTSNTTSSSTPNMSQTEHLELAPVTRATSENLSPRTRRPPFRGFSARRRHIDHNLRSEIDHHRHRVDHDCTSECGNNSFNCCEACHTSGCHQNRQRYHTSEPRCYGAAEGYVKHGQRQWVEQAVKREVEGDSDRSTSELDGRLDVESERSYHVAIPRIPGVRMHRVGTHMQQPDASRATDRDRQEVLRSTAAEMRREYGILRKFDRKTAKCIIDPRPSHSNYRHWVVLRSILVLWVAIWTPFEVAVIDPFYANTCASYTFGNVLNLLIDIFFFFDMVLRVSALLGHRAA